MADDSRPLDIMPGIFKEASEYGSVSRYVDGNNVRFWKGFPERIGGNTELTGERCFKPPRGMIAWRSISGTQLVAFGHAHGVQLLQGGVLTDISPTGTDGFTTYLLDIGSITGTYQTGEAVSTTTGTGFLTEATASSPMEINGDNGTHELALTSVSGTFLTGEAITGATGSARVKTGTSSSPIDIYDLVGTLSGTITGASSGATGTYSSITTHWTGTITGGTSGATCTISDFNEAQEVDSGATTTWGESTWGTGVWGGAESVYSTTQDATTWTMAMWGEDLIACPRGGKIYQLDTSAWIGDDTTNLEVLSGAPTNALGIFMNPDNRTLLAYGAHDGTGDDPVNIRWCDEEDNTVWTATSANTAGSLRCENGSTIVGVMSARQGHLISTDTAIYLLRYIGLPFVFGLTQVAEQSALIGPHASAEMDGITYWMGPDGFYIYDGSVRPLACDVHQYIFSRLNLVQGHKVHASPMRAYNEIWWYYVGEEGVELNSYVAFNTVEKTWHIGSKARSSQIDSSVVLAYPMGVETDGTVNGEELGTTDNGALIPYTLETAEIEVGDGQVYIMGKKLIPDYNRIGSTGTHSVAITTRGFPQRTERSHGPFAVTGSTEFISVRSRGAMMQFQFSGDDDFRLGRWRYRVTGKGRKDG